MKLDFLINKTILTLNIDIFIGVSFYIYFFFKNTFISQWNIFDMFWFDLLLKYIIIIFIVIAFNRFVDIYIIIIMCIELFWFGYSYRFRHGNNIALIIVKFPETAIFRSILINKPLRNVVQFIINCNSFEFRFVLGEHFI